MTDAEQAAFAVTGGLHASGLFDASGEPVCVREDVGRHNALDKLIGAALRARHDPAKAFVVVTSRCSYEMVEKTAIAGVSRRAAEGAVAVSATEHVLERRFCRREGRGAGALEGLQ